MRLPGRALGLVLFALATTLAGACSTADEEDAGPVCGPEVTYESFAGPFFLDWCTGCHSSALAKGERQEAPLDTNFNTLDGIRSRSDRILEKAVHTHAMPPAGGPSDEERALLGEWFSCGAPSSTRGFAPEAPPETAPEPAPSGACAAPREPLPSSILPRCSAETYTCVQNCALQPEGDADDCREACQKADTTPADTSLGYAVDCSSCVFLQLLACGEASGCHEDVARLMCCITSCATSSDPNCFQDECNGEITAFGYCAVYQGTDCLDYDSGLIGACFARAL